MRSGPGAGTETGAARRSRVAPVSSADARLPRAPSRKGLQPVRRHLPSPPPRGGLQHERRTRLVDLTGASSRREAGGCGRTCWSTLSEGARGAVRSAQSKEAQPPRPAYSGADHAAIVLADHDRARARPAVGPLVGPVGDAAHGIGLAALARALARMLDVDEHRAAVGRGGGAGALAAGRAGEEAPDLAGARIGREHAVVAGLR